jgi:hypothetical protein
MEDVVVLSVCGHTVHTTSILIASAWLDCSCWWSSRLEVFLGGGWFRLVSAFLSIAPTQAGMKIHGSGCYHTIVWAEEYDHLGIARWKSLVHEWEDFREHENVPKSCLFALGAHRRTFEHRSIVSTESAAVIHASCVLLYSFVFFWLRWMWSNMAVLNQKSTEISLCMFSYAKLQPDGSRSTMSLVPMLMHARWRGQLAVLR